MRVKFSVAACAVLALFTAQANAADTVKLEGVEINSVGDNISESGISEGILTKNVQKRDPSQQKGTRYAVSDKHDHERNDESPGRDRL